MFLLPVLVIFLGGQLRAVVVSLVLKDCVITGLSLWLCSSTLPDGQPQMTFEWSRFRPIWSFGAWLFILNLASQILLSLERLLIPGLLGMSALSLYYVPFSLTQKLMTLPGLLMAVLFPALSSIGFADQKALEALFWKALKWLACSTSLISLGLMLFAREIMLTWLGVEFEKSITVLQVLAPVVFLSTVCWLLGSMLQALGYIKELTLLALPLIPPQILLTWSLIQSLGLEGAAAASLTHRVLTIILLSLFLTKKGVLTSFGSHLALAVKPTLALLAPFAILLLVRAAATPSTLESLVQAALLLVALGAVVWRLVSSDEERAFLRTLLRSGRGAISRSSEAR
jgi:O-antigen/teichoic acid export membrane protein